MQWAESHAGSTVRRTSNAWNDAQDGQSARDSIEQLDGLGELNKAADRETRPAVAQLVSDLATKRLLAAVIASLPAQ